MDINLLREAVMVVGLIVFLGIVCWAYGPQRRGRFERAAWSVFDDDQNDVRSRAQLAPDNNGRKES